MEDKLIEHFKKIDMEPFNAAMDVISGKWKMNILFSISEGKTLRYSEIKKIVGNITHHILSSKLKELEENGLIRRHVYSQIPPKVEYSLTDEGKTLLPILKMICNWGRGHRIAGKKEGSENDND